MRQPGYIRIQCILSHLKPATSGTLPRILAIATILILLLTHGIYAALPSPVRVLDGRIIWWVDGDTVHVLLISGPGLAPQKVRLIGIDAPEISYGERASRQGTELGKDTRTIVELGRKAKAAAERLAPPGTVVRLELDVQTRDRYGRLLAYLWLPDGRMINEELVRQGWAMVYTIPPNVRYVERFVRAQREAREAGRGLWNR